MPKGQRRYGPPPGYMTSREAMKLLGRMLYKHVAAGRIRKIAPEGHQQGFYHAEDIQAILTSEKAFSQEIPLSTDATFAIATPADMDALYRMAVKLFPRTANAEIRREWMRKEPRGHFIMKRSNGDVVAYIYLLRFRSAEILASYLHDELPSREISREHTERFQVGQVNPYVAIGGIGSDPDIDQELRSTYTALLVRGVRHELAQWGEQGIIIPDFYAFSERSEGIAMCIKLGMQQWQEPRANRWFTFVLHTETSKVPFLREYKQGLAKWQEAGGPGVVSSHD